ncbi:hypothetical protein BMS3Abin06_01081 [bacterium BMS3Abin06]|nr:hypothetical protein BMS3Abin06_01081 [bacterium BMS3Abin06]
MATLTKKEILAQLKKIGVNSTTELNTYSMEYEEYFTLHEPYPHSPQEYYERAEDN